MTKLDDAIRDALSDEDRAFLDELEVQPKGMFGEIAAGFSGRLGGWAVLVWVETLVMVGVAVIGLWRLTQAETTLGIALWSLLVVFGMLASAMLKMWYWMHLNTNAVMREMKRVELQVARLAAQK